MTPTGFPRNPKQAQTRLTVASIHRVGREAKRKKEMHYGKGESVIHFQVVLDAIGHGHRQGPG